MVKELIVFLLFLSCNLTAFARLETWNGQTKDASITSWLPPWNREGGREQDNICLLKKEIPGDLSLYYSNICAEESPETTYFSPKIRVRGQQCNAVACWTSDDTLKGDGECTTLIGSYVFPRHRICARIAVPGNAAKSLEPDPGYTKGKHLNFEGATKDDELITLSDRSTIVPERPKLCIYYDPAFYNVGDTWGETGWDLMDMSDYSQPFHKTTKTHWIMEYVITAMKTITDISATPAQLLSIIFDALDDDTKLFTEADVLSWIFKGVANIVQFIGGAIVWALERYGQINRIVGDEEYGCVNLPLGPFPPPYCESVKTIFQPAIVQNICYVGKNGFPVKSTESSPCVVSTVRNNYIHNSIRVGYNHLVPLCPRGVDAATTDKCVTIKNLENVPSASMLHISTARRDIIKPCSGADDKAVCVYGRYNLSNAQEGFRIVYGTKIGTKTTPNAYFSDELDNCSDSKSAMCQDIWGVNTGEFTDVSLQFDKIEDGYSVSPISSTFRLKDNNGSTRQFSASIIKKIPSGGDASSDPIRIRYTNQTPWQICVFENSELVGCENRAPKPRLSVYECGDKALFDIKCTSSYFEPKFIVAYNAYYKAALDKDSAADDIEYYKLLTDETRVEKDTTAALVEPASIYSTQNANNVINLAGDEFEAFVTNDSFAVKPFSGKNAPNPSTILGKYQDDIMPIDSSKNSTDSSLKYLDDQENTNAVYLSGLEYINGKYRVGGKYLCLNAAVAEQCPQDPTACILTKLLNADIVSCKIFNAKQIKYSGFGRCSDIKATDKECSVVDSLAAQSGNPIDIKLCRITKKSDLCQDRPSADCKTQTQEYCYEYATELCKVSSDDSDRIEPSASFGVELANNQYYNTTVSSQYSNAPSAPGVNYDMEKASIRNKTAFERSLCIALPQDSCAEQNDYSEENGFAYWPSASVGEEAHGTCKEGWEPVKPLIRVCIPSFKNKSFIFEPLYRVKDNDGQQKRIYTDIKCKKKKEDDEKKDTSAKSDDVSNSGNVEQIINQ